MKIKDLKINFRYLGGNIACLSVDSISGESVHNDINNEEAIIIFNSLVGEKADCQTVKSLLKENQELKKQLEKDKNKYIKRCNESFAEGIDVDPEDLYMAELEQRAMDCELMEMQQKEFINYLEDKIYSIEPKGTSINYNCEYDSEEDYVMAMQEQSRLNTLKEILQKYKEIIGDDK
jgi:hypothetical protein|nr:MAG TPA: hypothetical protein [Caudoviricetes sp.]